MDRSKQASVSSTRFLRFEPLKDTPWYGRELIRRVRELVARRAEAVVPA